MKTFLILFGLTAAVTLTYLNHFHNGFHFDDGHAVVDNPYIRSFKNVPLFFTDARTFSVLPSNRTYRPLVSLSLAIDYWLGNGLKPVDFQASTFFWYLVQLVTMFGLFRTILERVRPDPRNEWVAMFAAALYGLHPAMAETVNYVIQRGDLYSTLGVVAGLALYVWFPRQRKFGWYLVPVAMALLSKPPALVFPAILFAYILLFEETAPAAAFKRSVPSLVVAGAFGFLTSAMTPKAYNPGASSAFAYRITQPLVALRYFRAFFIPDQLSADTDHVPLNSIFAGYAWLGFIFVFAVAALAVYLSRRHDWRPTAFGLWWFLLALLPTAVFPLAEVENDHRMFFPFVGLALAASWTAALCLYRTGTRAGEGRSLASHARICAIALVVLAAFAAGTWRRNEVWHSDESLWRDVTIKSPNNGRGLMNYGLTQMAKGDTVKALDYFERALVLTPAYSILEVNLGIANGVLQRDAEAERHFLRAVELAPFEATSHYFYADWLGKKGRSTEAIAQLEQTISLNPDYLAARSLLANLSSRVARAQPPASSPSTADDYLNLSLVYNRSGKFRESIEAANNALQLKPDCAEAYNNIAAAYEEMKMWDPAIEAARHALELQPDFVLARNNLQWSESQKKQQGERPNARTDHAGVF